MDSLIARITEWAQTQENIRGALLLGSRARTDRPADEWSDADILVLANDVNVYLSSGDWLHEIGDVKLTYIEPTATGGQLERRAMFDGMRDVDFSIAPADELKMLAEAMEAGNVPPHAQHDVEEIADVVRRGFRVLVDKDDILAKILDNLPPVQQTLPVPPTETQFLNVVNDFWYHSVWVTKKLRRGELWTAKASLDSYMKWRCVLPLIQWHTKATHGWQTDTWHNGRFIEQWADQRIIEGLRESFALYDTASVARALLAQMDSFREAAIVTAKLLGYPYPHDADAYCTAWVKEQLKAS